MQNRFSSRQAAKLVGVQVDLLYADLRNGRIPEPGKNPNGNFEWTVADVERAKSLPRRSYRRRIMEEAPDADAATD